MRYVSINAGLDTDKNIIEVTDEKDALVKIINHLEEYVTYNTNVNDIVAKVRTDPSILDLPEAKNTLLISLLMEGIEYQYIDFGTQKDVLESYQPGDRLLIIKDQYNNVVFSTDASNPDVVELVELVKKSSIAVNVFTGNSGAFDDVKYKQYLDHITESPDPVRFITESPVFNKILELNNYRSCFIIY